MSTKSGRTSGDRRIAHGTSRRHPLRQSSSLQAQLEQSSSQLSSFSIIELEPTPLHHRNEGQPISIFILLCPRSLAERAATVGLPTVPLADIPSANLALYKHN
mmetsp:Transcript_13815/g.30408  ORF Transcript_13815/g.30408 Transcript_13815/m.30408 type:complete len:103 (-) Transcript_13815:80-388(-)